MAAPAANTPPTQEEIRAQTSNGGIGTCIVILLVVLATLYYWGDIKAYYASSAAEANRTQKAADWATTNQLHPAGSYLMTTYPRRGTVEVSRSGWSEVVEVTAVEKVVNMTFADEGVTLLVNDNSVQYALSGQHGDIAPNQHHNIRFMIAPGGDQRITRSAIIFSIDQAQIQ